MRLNSIEEMQNWRQAGYNSMWELVAGSQSADTGESLEQILAQTAKVFEVMKTAATAGMSDCSPSLSGLTGGDACQYGDHIINGRSVLGSLPSKALGYAIATNEYNASMGVIVAAPTAGSSGILPGVVIAAQEELGFSNEQVVRALLIAGGVGAVIALRATISGAAGGCQAECGSAAAMAASTLAYLLGGDESQVAAAGALALKNSLGLACDPVAGLVEVPCIKRNGIYAVMAVAAADMAMAGIKSVIPFDEVIDAMFQIGSVMPACIKETAEGGLAISPTGLAAKRRIFGVEKPE